MSSASNPSRQIILLSARILLWSDLPTQELLRIQVLLVHSTIIGIASEETVVHLGFHLRFFARDEIRVRAIGNLLVCSICRLMGVLALGSLRYVL